MNSNRETYDVLDFASFVFYASIDKRGKKKGNEQTRGEEEEEEKKAGMYRAPFFVLSTQKG